MALEEICWMIPQGYNQENAECGKSGTNDSVSQINKLWGKKEKEVVESDL